MSLETEAPLEGAEDALACSEFKDSEKRTEREINLMLAPLGFKILTKPLRTYPVTI
jgi:hypothetical protein